MNQEKFALFSQAYHAALVIAVDANPGKYTLPPRNELDESPVPEHAQRILDAMAANPLAVMYTGDAFKIVCKALAIKHTRKAIFAFLEIA